MKSLYLIRAPLTTNNLARWSAERGWLRRGAGWGGIDEGRALHHLLDELFGPRVFRPFRLLVANGGRIANLYGYSTQNHQSLRDAALAHGMPEHTAVVSPDRIMSKEMPMVWTSGRRVGFDLRVRPIRRLKSSIKTGGRTFRKGAELDAFLVEALRRHPDDDAGMSVNARSRESVYLDWLEARLGDAARLERPATRLARFRRVRVSRGSSGPEGPDATFHGEISVRNPDLFWLLLSRGVGRHRAYGYGMLLLRPPNRSRWRRRA